MLPIEQEPIEIDRDAEEDGVAVGYHQDAPSLPRSVGRGRRGRARAWRSKETPSTRKSPIHLLMRSVLRIHRQ